MQVRVDAKEAINERGIDWPIFLLLLVLQLP